MFFYRNALLGLLLAAVLAGCASLSPGAVWQVRSFGVEDFLAIEADELAVRVNVSEAYVPDLDSFELALRLSHQEQVWDQRFALRLLEQHPRSVSTGWFSADRKEVAYKLVLADEAVSAFRNQQSVFQDLQPSRAAASVTLRFVEFPQDYEPAVLSIELSLREGNGYFPLIQEATLELDDRSDANR